VASSVVTWIQNEIVGTRQVGRRINIDRLLAGWVEARRRNLVARERVADGPCAGGIGARRGRVGDGDTEYPVGLVLGRARRQVRPALGDARALVAAEQEQLVAHQRPAAGSAKLVLAESWQTAAGAVVEKIVGVERVVPQKLEHRAMQIVRAGL